MFNFSKKLAFGLDLSDASFKIIQFKENAGRLSISSFVKCALPAGLVVGGEVKKEDELVSIFKKAFAKPSGLPFKGKRVICSLPEEKIFIRVIQLPKMKEEELSDAVKWEAEAHIPLVMNEAYLGWRVIGSNLKKTDHFDILIAGTPRYIVDNYLSFLRKSNLQAIAFEPESLSVVRSLIKKDDTKPTIIVDLGAVGTNFVIFSALAIRFTSHINISGNLFNQEIMKKLKVSQEKANQLKIKNGLDKTKQDGKVYQAIEPVIGDLVKQIGDYIAFYHDHSSNAHILNGAITQIVLCGGDSYLLNLPEFISEKLNLPVKIGNPLINASSQSVFSKKQILSEKESLIYTTAIGLALKEITQS